MAAMQKIRGYPIVYDYNKNKWVYRDTGKNISDEVKACKRCKVLHKPEDHDCCLRDLGCSELVAGACCGHGNNEDAYILLKDGRKFILDRDIGEF